MPKQAPELLPLTSEHVGFTGTRADVPPERAKSLKKILRKLYRKGFRVLHHGDAIGCDTLAHDAAKSLGYQIVIHPPTIKKYRAFNKPGKGVQVVEEKDYLARNRDIVDSSAVLIAMPKDPSIEEQRSGTWACIRYARKRNVPIRFVE